MRLRSAFEAATEPLCTARVPCPFSYLVPRPTELTATMPSARPSVPLQPFHPRHQNSFCIEKKQPYCHYQLKQVAKARASKQAAARQGPSSSSPPSDPYGSFGARKRVVGVPEVAVHSDLGMMTVVGVRSIATGPGSMPLKRYGQYRLEWRYSTRRRESGKCVL